MDNGLRLKLLFELFKAKIAQYRMPPTIVPVLNVDENGVLGFITGSVDVTFGYLTRLTTSDTDTTDYFGSVVTASNGNNGLRKPFPVGSIFTKISALGRNRTFDPPLQICAGFPALWTFPLPCDCSFR